jgi:hypothetical protein
LSPLNAARAALSVLFLGGLLRLQALHEDIGRAQDVFAALRLGLRAFAGDDGIENRNMLLEAA